MNIGPTYISVFFEVDVNIGYKRIDFKTYVNLIDDLPDKKVVLNGAEYKILSTKEFNIINSIDNNCFVICQVVKIK